MITCANANCHWCNPKFWGGPKPVRQAGWGVSMFEGQSEEDWF